MIETGFESRVKVQQVIESQLPEFIKADFPKYVDFLKQYYISQEYQGGPVDIAENLDQYLKLDNITPEVVSGITSLTSSVTESSQVISVLSTKGYPSQYGLLKIGDEIITYTGLTTNTFTGCVRGFCGITKYNNENDPGELVFTTSEADSHESQSQVTNLSALFLKEFYDKIRFSIAPGLEKVEFVENLDVSNFIKESRTFYEAKGTPESFRILFKVLYNQEPKVLDLEEFLIKPSVAQFNKREVVIAERISGNPLNLLGQTIRRSLNPTVESSVSAVEILTRGTKTYYKLSLFVGYDFDIPEGNFLISGKTRVLRTVPVGASVISVDSTIGFPESGILISGNNTITYTNKSVNQFFGCSGVTEEISSASDVRSTETVFGYENGDLTKKVELRITGVLRSFTPGTDEFIAKEGEKIFVKNIGELIKNPSTGKTYKEVIANSLIYNTSCRYEVGNISGSTFTLLSDIDDSSLKVGDFVDILFSGSQTAVVSNVTVLSVNKNTKQIQLSSGVADSSQTYDIRRKLIYASSSGADLLYGNDQIIASVQNFYVNDEYGYIASNSLPNYPITKDIVQSSIPLSTGSPTLSSLGQGYIQGFDEELSAYSIISFDSNTNLQTGDAVVYESQNSPLTGLVNGRTYYILVDPLQQGLLNQIRLYPSRSFIGSSSFVTFNPPQQVNDGKHTFILEENAKKVIGSQKLLRKFPLSQNISGNIGEEVTTGGVGLLVNGVEIISPKSDNKVYYGPLTNVLVFNRGRDYDVINPPNLIVDAPPGNISGTRALINPVISGQVQSVFVDPQEFEIDEVISVTISGGNGNGAVLNPVISKKFREIEFDARPLSQGGGLDIVEETITFDVPHNLVNGEEIIYNPNGNNPLGISSYFKSSLPESISNAYDRQLVNGSKYYVSWVNTSTIRLYETLNDFRSGINTVGITTENNFGIHKFRTIPKNKLQSINVINSGSGYQNRNLYVKSSGISTTTNSVIFKNHNFNDGDLIVYNHTNVPISGLSSSRYYYVLKNSLDSFQLADAGLISIGATITSNLDRRRIVGFSSVSAAGYHIFKYPDISVSVTVSYGSSIVGVITATPVVTGSIIDAYLYEEGTDYGSNILNLERVPDIIIQNGKNAEVRPVVIDGRIEKVEVLSKGTEYYSSPLLKISGDGSGAIIRPVLVNNKLDRVVVCNPGIGYSNTNTTIRVVPRGSGAILKSNIRPLTLNNQFRFSDEILIDSDINDLKYGLVGYNPTIGASEFKDTGSAHSPIIGWAYDGNPIYGPYGYSNPQSATSTRLLNTGYSLSPDLIKNRPSLTEFPSGYFIEDYSFDNSGDLDLHNGRFCKTPEFPDGVYAYFAGIQTNFGSNTLQPKYPYFVGNYYKSPKIKENEFLDQSFDFNGEGLSRNTFPYKVSDEFADNDFIVESNEIINQTSVIDSVTSGSVESIDILASGSNYKINDQVIFETPSVGSGLDVIVSELKGKRIENIQTEIQTYTNSVLEWKDQSSVLVTVSPYHTLVNGDSVVISGVNTTIGKLTGNHIIGFSSERTFLQQNLTSNAIAGFVTDIYVSRIPERISVGSSLLIESEILSVLNIFRKDAVLRVKRSDVGSAHTETTEISVLTNNFTIPVSTDYFDSKVNEKVYFNPHQSVGVGSASGVAIGVTYRIGNVNTLTSVQTQSIYLPDHPFKTGQIVTFGKSATNSPVAISTLSTSTPFHWPSSGDTATVYIIKQSKDFIGFTTVAGLSTSPVYITHPGTDAYDYYFESQNTQVTGQVQKIKATVGVQTYHQLRNGDEVTLYVKPIGSVGIGTTLGSVSVKYDSSYEKLIIEQRSFQSSDINSSQNSITISNHELKTGDKVLYRASTPASGLSEGEYYVYVVDDNTIKLCETIKDVKAKIPLVVDISSGGTNQTIGLINPQIKQYRNTNLIFNTADSSLSGYKLKFFYDKELKNEFVSVANTSIFNVSYATSSVTLRHSNYLPDKLYYSLEKNGYISTSDSTVQYASEILFVDSIFNNTYTVSDIVGSSSTTFSISLSKKPEKYSYSQSNCDVLEYSTSSTNALGGIYDVRILFGGFGFKEIPSFVTVDSRVGIGANLLARSKSIANINNITILEQGFEYSADKTLRPEASIAPIMIIKDSYNVDSVDIIATGKNYVSAPKLILVDVEENIILDDANLEPVISSGAVNQVNILAPINGISLDDHRVIAINNSNGVFISSITQNANEVTCVLSTPIVGFFTDVFSVGEEIFVEGIEKDGTYGSGFNSADYNYQFFKVKQYQGTVPAKVTFDLSNFTTNPGYAKSGQSGFGVIVSRNNYPEFKINQSPTLFSENEPILTDMGSGFNLRNARVSESRPGYFKIVGPYVPSTGELVKGKYSGVIARVSDVIENSGKFEISFSNIANLGWNKETGKLNTSYQAMPDNDYYQNLSYSVWSNVEYGEMSNAVNSLLHTSGLKNFADVQIKNVAGIENTGTTNDTILLDVVEDKRVDTINNFDIARDIYTNSGRSRFIKLKNKTLSDYFICASNRVLKIDDISSNFLDKDSITESGDVVVDTLENDYQQYLVQIVDPASKQTQLTEVVVLNKGDDSVFTLEKATLVSSDELLGDIQGTKDDVENIYLGITPTDLYDTDYDYKIIKQYFTSIDSSGIGTQAIGFIDLTSSNNFIGVSTSPTTGITTIFSRDIGKVDSVYFNIFIKNVLNNNIYYSEVFLDHDSTNTYISDFSFDTNTGISTSIPGSFDASIESGKLLLKYTNNDTGGVLVKTSIVGFGTTSVGIGTYRFKEFLQLDGTERSARFESTYSVSSGVSTSNLIQINSLLDSSVKSIVRVSYGNTSALHQVMLVNDLTESYTLQYPFLSIGSTSGIGTFGSEFNGTDVILKFYPDPNITENIEIRSFNEILYRDFDLINLPPDLEYGTSKFEIILSQYNAINGQRRESSAFDAKYNNIPIFEKTFIPYEPTQLDPVSGKFTINSHFFETGEELIYTPTSTFPGLSASSVGIGSTTNYVGVVTNILPSTVYAIKIDNNNFKLATRKDYANAGIYVTFTSFGEGNAHKLEMVKKDEKSIISLNGVVQKPLTFTPITYNLDSNGGQIGVGNSFISLSGIATIKTKDLMKIENEYVQVLNVGLGTTYSGPIVGFGTYKIAEVRRGYVGTSATVHSDGVSARVYRGAFTISGSKIYFTEAPKGNKNEKIGLDGLISPKDTFNGRVYLRKDYSKNVIYDDISDQFTGIGQTFEITVQGISTVGVETGSGILFINDVYQTPTTSNNTGNNYFYSSNGSKTFVEFTGISSSSGSASKIINEFDINQNQLPRGGIVVSLGSTNGLGFAPLVGIPTSHIEIKVGTGGTILSVGFTTAFINGYDISGTVGVTTNRITGISTGALKVGQRIKTVTTLIQSNTVINSIGITSIGISKSTLNSVGLTTTFNFEGSIIYGSGYYGSNISIGVTDSTGVGTGGIIRASIGAGGTITGFSVINQGIGYTNPSAMVPDPSYENLPVIGVSRVSTGATTETGKGLLVTLEVGASSTTGIGSTLFEVRTFKISRPGYQFEVGDVIKPVGLVTAFGLSQPLEEFELTVTQIFDDSFASWQFGELDFIDSIALLQDGRRTRFPLYYNAQLLSIETDLDLPGSADIDLSSVLLIFVNGVIQEPNVSYTFTGGTSFEFSDPPSEDAQISIYFYRGTRGVDSKLINITETVKNGDLVQLFGSSSYPIQQDSRTIFNITTSDVIETNAYSGLGVTESYDRPLFWTKQKSDKFINGDAVYKSRDSLEAQVYPTAKIIADFDSTDTEIFVDDGAFFGFEGTKYGITIDSVDLLIKDSTEPTSARLQPAISSGEVNAVNIIDGGSGYGVTSLTVKFSKPPQIDTPENVGVGSTATAIAYLTAGIVTSITITSPGYGYTVAPQALVSTPEFSLETVTSASGGNIKGFSGIITGITTTTGGGGHPLALKLYLQRTNASTNFDDLFVNYPIYITGTNVGYGVTSVDYEDSSIVGIGTEYLDNVYYIKSLTRNADKAEIVCNIHSSTNIVGIATTGTRENPVGRFSWGRISGFTRSTTNPISIGVTGLTVDAGLSTFPFAQRRGFGLRDIGAIRKLSSSIIVS